VALLHRILTSSLIGALLSLALLAPTSASAASPPSAYLRVEGAGATLLAQTLVHTTSTSQIKGKACPGTSVAGALDTGTGGNWTGAYSASFKDYLVSSILGEMPSPNNFWTLWVNGRSSSRGACSTALHPGDHVLWFDCQADASFNCTNTPLALTAPASVRRGQPMTVMVGRLDGAGHSSPAGGAAIAGGGAAAVSASTGRAALVFHTTGIIALQAEKSGATPSDPVFVCVYAVRAADCGKSGINGSVVHVAGITEHQVLARGPRELHGTVAPDPSGLTDVSLRLARRAPGGHCSVYDATRGTWRASKCSAAAPLFSVGADATWSYLLPRALGPGTYRLRVLARDGSGRQSALRLDFSVKR